MGHIQQSFIYDDSGQPIGVVLPYGDWLNLKSKEASDSQDKTKHLFRAGELNGKLDWGVDPVEFQRQVRDE